MNNSDVVNPYSRYDDMSKEELTQALSSIMTKSDDAIDGDEVMYIADLLNALDGDACPDAESAWEDFAAKSVSIAAQEKKPRRGLRVGHIAAIAAVFVVVLSLLTVTVSAGRADIIQTLTSWTGGYFAFGSSTENSLIRNGDKTLSPVLGKMAEDMQNYDIAYLLPSYIPEDYKCNEYTFFNGFEYKDQEFYMSLENPDGEEISLHYILHSDDSSSFNYYATDGSAPQIYTHGDTTYYILRYNGHYEATWLNGNGRVECKISGPTEQELLLKIVDSILDE